MKKIFNVIILLFLLTAITACNSSGKPQEYKVSFASNGGSIIDSVIIKEGITLSEPTSPTKEGYNFVGWYADYDLTIPYDFNDKIEKNITLYAKWESNIIEYSIFFNTNDGEYIEPMVFNKGNLITTLPIPYKNGYEFVGWYTDIELMIPFEYNSTISSDMVLYAKYQEKITKNYITVSFITNSEDVIDDRVVLIASVLSEVKLKDKDDYIFIGWYKDSSFTKLFSFDEVVYDDLVLYAKWEEKCYTILYEDIDGNLLYETNVYATETILRPTDPIKEGYEFVGWYEDINYEKEFDFNQKILKDIKLYAKWEKIVIKSSDATLKEIYVNGNVVDVIPTKLIYDIKLSSGKKIVIGALANDLNTTINGMGEYSLEVGNAITIKLEVVAEDNTKLYYTINVTISETSAKFLYCAGSFETIGITLIDSNYKEVKAYYKKSTDTIYNQVDKELIRLEYGIVRIDMLGLSSGIYDVKVITSDNDVITEMGIEVLKHDRSGYAFFDTNTNSIGAYNEDGTLKSNAVVIYVTNETKNTVKYNGKTGLVDILNSLKNVGVPVCIRILDSIKTNQFNEKSLEPRLSDGSNYSSKELVEFSTNTLSTEYGENLVGLTSKVTIQGYKNIVHTSTKTSSTVTESVRNSVSYATYNGSQYPNIRGMSVYDDDSSFNMVTVTSTQGLTIEGVGANAEIFQWGFNFYKSKNVEVRNLTFTNSPEDSCSFNGVSNSDNNYYGFWVHNNTFNKGYNAWDITGERDKYNGDGSIDLRYVHGVTLSYNKFNNTHKTGLVGGSDDNKQYNITFHHNYYYNVSSRLPLGRQANMHIYNNYYYNCSSTLDIRANAYVLCEGNYFENSRHPKVEVKTNAVSAVKSIGDVFVNCSGSVQITIVTKRDEKVSNTNGYGTNFDTNSNLFYYDSVNKKSNVMLLTDAYKAKEDCIKYAGVFNVE